MDQFKFEQLPLGTIKPKGWLLKQLIVQREGLSGNLDQFWPDIKDSKWFGGNADGWERAPYWLDGVVPLAYILDDTEFRKNIRGKMNMLFEKQADDGWPYQMSGEEKRNYDLWPLLLIAKVVYTYYQTENDSRCIEYLSKLFNALDQAMDRAPLRHWAQYRWFEGVIPLLGLNHITGEEKWLHLGRRMMDQGFNWYDYHRSPMVEIPAEKGRWSFDRHVVNNAMAIKANGISYMLTKEPCYLEALTQGIDRLEQYHGYVTGAFSGDEVLTGKSPVQGTELCAVAEYMYSLEVLIEMFGKGELADRLEKLTFNAWPATFLPDMWSHQYDQQINQVECSVKQGRTWKTNGPESNVFGLQPNFGCCTANMSQGWPKYAANLWMKSKDGGLAAISYAPCAFSITIHDVPVDVEVATEYPFKEKIFLLIQSEKPISFPIYIRIPKWCKKPVVSGVPFDADATVDGFVKTTVTCDGVAPVRINLYMSSEVELYKTPHETVSVLKGSLVYALPIEELKVRINEDQPLKELPHGDFELYPVSEWRYALDAEAPDAASRMEYVDKDVGDVCVFAPENAPASIYANAYLVE
ncbi:MAG TPA: hypothetical protein DDZ89_00255, partial [Clostridiales bacterium]|nr:hypothetical protein [Clostridiales bacterium]